MRTSIHYAQPLGKVLVILALIVWLFQVTACDDPSAELQSYTVVYSGNGNDTGTPPYDQLKYSAGDSVIVPGPSTLEKEGFAFAGWSESSLAAQTIYLEGTVFEMPANDVMLFAVWVRLAEQPVEEECTVTFHSNDGTLIPPQTVVKGNKIIRPNDPEKDQCTFLGWYRDSEFLMPWIFESDMVDSDITLYAKWRENDSAVITYTVTYYGNDNDSGTVPVDSNTYAAGDSFVAANSEDLSKTNCIFTGWAESATATTAAYTAGTTYMMPGRNLSLYAVFLRLYTITYVPDMNGTIEGNTSQNVMMGGDSTTVTAKPDRGYHFHHWSDGSKTKNHKVCNVRSDVTLTAFFEKDLAIDYNDPVQETVNLTVLKSVLYTSTGDRLDATVSNVFDSIQWYIDGSPIDGNTGKLSRNAADIGIGSHTLTVIIVSKGIPYSNQTTFQVRYK